MEFLFELFKRMPRQGPGSEKTTLKALSKIALPQKPRILDAGCGTGGQTLVLAKNLDADIIAVDIHQPFLDILWHLAYHLKPKGRIETSAKSMDSLSFPKDYFDLIWSEGAVYLMGFESGLNSWEQFLKPGGYMAVSEVSWFKKDAPDEIREFWQREYPAIKTIEENLKIIEHLGLEIVDHFSLPDSDWTGEFYISLQERVEYFKKQNLNQEDSDILQMQAHEIELFRKYSAYYGYEFYILRFFEYFFVRCFFNNNCTMPIEKCKEYYNAHKNESGCIN